MMGHLADASARTATLSIEKEANMSSRRALDGILRGIAGGGPLLFFAIATAQGAVRQGYDPIAQPISALALGPHGWIQALNFLLLAASFFAFALVLRRALRPGTAAIAAPAVMLLMTMGLMISLLFPMDAPGASTLSGRLHLAGGFLIFPWMPVVVLVVARRFRREERWRPYFGVTLAIGLLSLATILCFLLFVGPPTLPRAHHRLAGLAQRIQLLPFFAWIALVTRLTRARS